MSKWGMVRLGDVCDVVSGFAFDSQKFTDDSTAMPIIRIRDVVRGFTATYTTEKYDKKFVVKKGDLLIGMDGEFNIAEWKDEPALLNQRVCKIFAGNESIFEKYLLYFMPAALKRIEDKTPFVTVKHISIKQIKEILIPLPSIEEQKRIADILDKASSLIDLRKQQLEKMDLLVKSKFIDMFGDPVTNPKGWEVKQLADFADIIMGQSPSGEAYNENGIGMPLLNGPTEFGEKYPSEKQWTSITTKTCHKGDILFCVRGATAGRMNFADKEYCIGRGLAAIRGNKKNFNEFIYVVLKNMYEIFQNTSNGSTFININKEQLASVPIFVTTDKLQDQYLHFVEQVEKQKTVMQQSLEKMETNYKALMQEYFG